MTAPVPPLPPGGEPLSRWIPIAGHSMWPALRAGDRAELVAAAELRPGQVLVVRSDRGLVVHRVRSVEAGRVRLQGDACARPDSPVALEAVLGQVARIERAGRLLGPERWDSFRPRLGRLHRALRARLDGLTGWGRSNAVAAWRGAAR